MQHESPRHSTSLTKWRQRVGGEKLVMLLEETVSIAVSHKHITRNELAQVNVDTTVQEKNITYPTDSKRYLKAIQKLGDAARNCGSKLRQTYRRVAKATTKMVGRYAHARLFKRMRNLCRNGRRGWAEFFVICVAKFLSQMRLWKNCRVFANDFRHRNRRT
jgi:IS5 family transposase